MAKRYREEIGALRDALARSEGRGEPAEHVRGLIEKIVLTPKPQSDEAGRDELKIDLYGDLAGILDLAAGAEAARKDRYVSGRYQQAVNDNCILTTKTALVAGAGFGTLQVVFDLAA